MKFDQRLKWFTKREMIMMFLWENRFLNPQISDQLQKIKSSGLLGGTVMKVMEEYFPKYDCQLPKGMYFPIPMSRAIDHGEIFSKEIALKFHYDFIKVNAKQQWSLRDKKITGKILSHFKSNLYYEKLIRRYFVEYWNDKSWDKCYLECSITPMLALAVYAVPEGLKIQLNNNKFDMIHLDSFRMDKKERCFVQSKNFGEVLLADSPRFWLLDNLDDSGKNFVVKEGSFPLNFN